MLIKLNTIKNLIILDFIFTPPSLTKYTYIECDKKNGYKYYIGNDNVLENDSVQNWLLSTLSVNNIISESLSMQKRILLQSIPAEDGYLGMVIEAMKRSVRIAVDYRKYGTDNPNHLNFEPYCLKMFKQRWYVLVYAPDIDQMRVYSLDRIHAIEPTKQKYKLPKDFNAEAYFRDTYGVSGSDDEPETIEIKIDAYQANYLRTLPPFTRASMRLSRERISLISNSSCVRR